MGYRLGRWLVWALIGLLSVLWISHGGLGRVIAGWGEAQPGWE